MSLAEEDEVPKALVFDRSDEALSVRIAIGTLGRKLDACDAVRLGVALWPENRLEVRGEERIGVVNEMRGVSQETIDRVGQVARDLFHPSAIGIHSNACDVDLASLELDDEKDHVSHGPKDSKCLHCEEVARIEGSPVGVHKLPPGAPLLAFWSRDDARFTEYIGDCAAADVDAKSNADSISDLRVAPTEVVTGYG